MLSNITRPIVAALIPLISFAACAPWTPISQNPNRIRSPERLAYEDCLQKTSGSEAQCLDQKKALLMEQEWEMMTPDR